MNLSLGDHVWVKRRVLKGMLSYSHHGIYIGNDKVIHYAGYAHGFSRSEACQKVSIISLHNFRDGQPIAVKEHNGPFSRTDVVARAQSRLHEDSYNLVIRNCEHFATWCWTGKASSPQVNKVATRTASTLTLFVALGLTYNTMKNKG